jgi:hypothetical protein
MKTLPFEWAEAGSLKAALLAPISRATLKEFAHRPNVLTLWRTDGSRLRVRSTMHEISERIEIGVLQFDLESETPTDLVEVTFKVPLKPSRIRKLVISESGVQAESGIVLECEDQNEITIVAGTYPYTLGINGLFESEYAFETEYAVDKYTSVEL